MEMKPPRFRWMSMSMKWIFENIYMSSSSSYFEERDDVDNEIIELLFS